MLAIFKFKLQLDFTNRTKRTANCGVVDMLVSNTWPRNREEKNNKQKPVLIACIYNRFGNRDTKLMIHQMSIFQSGKNVSLFFVIRESFWPRQRPITNSIYRRSTDNNNNKSIPFGVGCFIQKSSQRTNEQQQQPNDTTVWLVRWTFKNRLQFHWTSAFLQMSCFFRLLFFHTLLWPSIDRHNIFYAIRKFTAIRLL